MLEQIDGERSVGEVVEAAGLDRKVGLEVIDKLEKAGIVTLTRSRTGDRGGQPKTVRFTNDGLKAKDLLIALGRVDFYRPSY